MKIFINKATHLYLKRLWIFSQPNLAKGRRASKPHYSECVYGAATVSPALMTYSGRSQLAWPRITPKKLAQSLLKGGLCEFPRSLWHSGKTWAMPPSLVEIKLQGAGLKLACLLVTYRAKFSRETVTRPVHCTHLCFFWGEKHFWACCILNHHELRHSKNTNGQ